MTRDEIIQSSFQQLIDNIAAAHVAAGQKVSGTTIGSLEIQSVTAMGGQLWGASYIGVLDKGRRPGKFPPIAPIEQWVIARQIHTAWGMTSKSAAFIIARKIAQEGSTLYRQGGRSHILQDNVDKFFEDVASKILDYEVAKIENKIFEKS
jgi:hypothetical protein